MSWGQEFLVKYGGVIDLLGSILNGVGEVVPIAGGGIKALGLFASHFGTKGKEQAEDRKQISAALELLISQLEATYNTLSKYQFDDRRESKLTLEVKIALTACYEWGKILESKKVVKDMLVSITTRTTALQFAISQETLEQAARAAQRAKLAVVYASLDKKTPQEYYHDAYYLINQKRWLEAKAHLICYRNYVEAKHPVKSEKDPEGVQPPESDKHLKWLMVVQDQLMLQAKGEADPVISVMSSYVNIYKKLWDRWEATYMRKKSPSK